MREMSELMTIDLVEMPNLSRKGPNIAGMSALLLTDPVRCLLKVGPLAARTATGAGKTLPVLKNISTRATPERLNDELFPLGCCGAGDMGEMLVYLLFPDAHCLGESPGAHLRLTQKDDHLLTNRVHLNPDVLIASFEESCNESPGFSAGPPVS